MIRNQGTPRLGHLVHFPCSSFRIACLSWLEEDRDLALLPGDGRSRDVLAFVDSRSVYNPERKRGYCKLRLLHHAPWGHGDKCVCLGPITNGPFKPFKPDTGSIFRLVGDYFYKRVSKKSC
jgi:hypothetical protein